MLAPTPTPDEPIPFVTQIRAGISRLFDTCSRDSRKWSASARGEPTGEVTGPDGSSTFRHQHQCSIPREKSHDRKDGGMMTKFAAIHADAMTLEALEGYDDMMMECVAKVENFASLATMV